MSYDDNDIYEDGEKDEILMIRIPFQLIKASINLFLFLKRCYSLENSLLKS